MKLIITKYKISEASFQEKYEFIKFPVNLGRESENEIVLEDTHKIISRKHAKIVSNNNKVQVIDLGSSNFTFLNGQRILPNDEYELKSNDKIIIGDYELEITLKTESDFNSYDPQKTMVFSSPFVDEISKIYDDLEKLSEKYSVDNSPMKSEMIRYTVKQKLNSLPNNETNLLVAEYLANRFLNYEHIVDPNLPRDLSLDKRAHFHESKSESNQVHYESISKMALDSSFSTYFSETFDLMLDTMTKLIQGFLHFRQEFFGVTIFHTIPTESLDEIKAFLFDQNISLEEQKKRLALIKEELQKILSHQMGLLEGYKLSVTEGSQSLLQSLDPEIIEKEATSNHTNQLEDLLPFLKKLKALEEIKHSYKKYMMDTYHIERKYFRPAFLKGYQKRISSKNEKNEY